jgi:RNA polymerase sigma factor (sigma-70 family)
MTWQWKYHRRRLFPCAKISHPCRTTHGLSHGSIKSPLTIAGNRDAEDSPQWESTSQRNENPERQLQHQELSEVLQEALLELNDEQREVVIMKEYEGLKFREIAEVLNISENTVKSRMYYGLDGLRKILERKNINKETIGYGI